LCTLYALTWLRRNAYFTFNDDDDDDDDDDNNNNNKNSVCGVAAWRCNNFEVEACH